METTGEGLYWLWAEGLNIGEWEDKDKRLMKEQMIWHCLLALF